MKQLEFNFCDAIAFVIQYDVGSVKIRVWQVYKKVLYQKFESTLKYCELHYFNVKKFLIHHQDDIPKELVEWRLIHGSEDFFKYDECAYFKQLNYS